MANGLKVADFGIRTVANINFHVEPGRCMGLSGPSGAGKTLLLRALADLDPHQGSMWLDGVAADEMPVELWRRKVGLLPAESAWWHDGVGAHFSEIHDPWLTALGFDRQVMTWHVRRLSSGERQRLALLRLLMLHPEVLLLDEPSANLDADNTCRVESLLNAYRADRQPVILWVSHNPGQLERNCDTLYAFRNGALAPVEKGRPK